MSSRRLVPAILAVLVLSATVSMLLASEHPAPVSSDPVEVAPESGTIQKSHGPAESPDRQISPMHREIRERLDSERIQLDELYAAVLETSDPSTAFDLQLQIDRLKRQTEIDVLLIQARYAESEGRPEQAAELKAAVAALLEPERTGTPTDRPAPTQQ